MMQKPVAIPKQPLLKPAEDFYRLRREGIGFIEQMGSRLWTDYNIHDPGITILEALCYAITDLAYRIGWDIKDLLTPAPPVNPLAEPTPPYLDQVFFTARQILTINPTTPDDFRRLLIDLNRVRNAWVFGKVCACDLHYYAWCEADQLQLSYQKPDDPLLQPVQVDPMGLYEVLLELEADPELGDLNDRKIEYTYTLFDSEDQSHAVKLELRFPKWELQQWDEWQFFLAHKAAFVGENAPSFGLKLLKFNRSKTDATPLPENEAGDTILRNNWRNLFYASVELEPVPGGKTITIENISLRIFGGTFAKSQATVAAFNTILRDQTATSIIQRYGRKLLKAEESVTEAKNALQSHRNLDEDFCRVKGVDVEDVAVCADVEVAPDADIERIQAQIWFEIDRYFNPPVPFYTLQELMDAEVLVEDIFNGPALTNGFIKSSELEAAGLKTVLRTSDIINRLMDIEGVMAVNELLLSKYDAEGNVVNGASDPVQTDTGLIFDPNKASAKWQLFVSTLHQPRLYYNQSQFLFYKNGLPFLPRMDEANDTLTQLRGEAERPKITYTITDKITNDLPAPTGTFRNPDVYVPVQYTFPMTYGIGPEGLPSQATPLRRAQAKQLKAYLMVFEQLLGNAFAQIANTADLFSLNPAIRQTYFGRTFSEAIIQGYGEFVNTDPTTGLTPAGLKTLVETVPEFEERRNRFLDHLMARFGEQFTDYALMLTNLQGQAVARERLIDDKIAFLKAYPAISHDRGKAFNYRTNLSDPANVSGLKRRVSLLLGYPDLSFVWQLSGTSPYTTDHYQLTDKNSKVWLDGKLNVSESDEATAQQKGLEQVQAILAQMVQPDSYAIVPEADQFRLIVKAENGDQLGQYPVLLKTESEAQALKTELLGWSSNERAIVVEHLLLRPKFPGDALYPACAEGDCGTCGDEDPYSFRLTYVMPGWTEPFSTNLDMRRFADRTIQQETPAHLLGKTCWVGNDGFVENPCDLVITDLADLLEAEGKTAADVRPTESEACACALALYTAFSASFNSWYADKIGLYFHPDALKTTLEATFKDSIDPTGLICAVILEPVLWPKVQEVMVAHFSQIALSGWQFERFKNAWQAWLQANAAIDWTEQHVQEEVEAVLASHVDTSFVPASERAGAVCRCATSVLTEYGMRFYNWMGDQISAGTAFTELDFNQFDPDKPLPLALCTDFTFKTGTLTALKALLKERYSTYLEVSYRLWVVVNLLSKLRNTYPGATLHDCDDGSDQNPVRLGSTALGNYPTKKPQPVF